MNFRNRKLVITVRIVLGLVFVFSGVTGFMSGFNGMQGIPAPMAHIMEHLWTSGIFQLIKSTEIVAGLMLVIGFLPALAAIFLAPVCIGALIFNAALAPAYIALPLAVTILNAFLGYAYWDKYRALFARN